MANLTRIVPHPAWMLAAAATALITALFMLIPGQTHAQNSISTESTRLWGTPRNGQYFTAGEVIRVRFALSAGAHVPPGVGINLLLTDQDGNVHKRFAAHNRDLSTNARPVFDYDVVNGDPKADRIAIQSGFRNGSVVGRNSDNTPNENVIVHFYGDDNLQTWEQETGEAADPASYGVDARPKVTTLGITSDPSVAQVVRSHNSTWTYDDFYRKGEKVYFVMGFDQPVDVVGSVCISLRIGTGNRTWRGAWYESGSGTAALVFTYTVQTKDYDEDGIGADSGGGSDRSSRYGFCGDGKIVSAGKETETSYSYNGFRNREGQNVDGRPYITSSEITSEPVSGSTYWTGEKIRFALNYTEPVQVAARPTIDVYFDYDGMPTDWNRNRKATYESGSGTTQVVFAYEVQEDDKDLDGAALKEGRGLFADFGLKDGWVVVPGTNREANNYFSHIADDPDHKVDGSMGDRIPPKLTSLTITSDAGTDQTYVPGDTIQVTAQFNENITIAIDEDASVSPEDAGKAGVFLTVGIGRAAVAFEANEDLGDDDQIVFEYTVQDGDFDIFGIYFNANLLTHLGFTIRDEYGNDAVVTYQRITGNSLHTVDAVAPKLVELLVMSHSDDDVDTYGNGDIIGIAGIFDEAITVTGMPRISFDIGGESRKAEFMASGSNLIFFQYTVKDGDSDTDGISVPAGSLDLNEGSITDPVGNNAILTHPALTDQENHKVDGTPVGGI